MNQHHTARFPLVQLANLHKPPLLNSGCPLTIPPLQTPLMSPSVEKPATSIVEQIKAFAAANPWVALIAAVIVLLIVGSWILKILKAAKHGAVVGHHGGQVKKALSDIKVGVADIIPGSTSTAVEITNSSKTTFTITGVHLLKNKTEFPLKLAYKGRISPPRSLPKITELHSGPAQLKPQDTFVFSHPVNAIFILSDKDSFTAVIDAKFEADGKTEKVRVTSSARKKKSLEVW